MPDHDSPMPVPLRAGLLLCPPTLSRRRLSLMATLALSLLGWVGAAATAQSEDADMDAAPIGVVIDATYQGGQDEGQRTYLSGGAPSAAFYKHYDRITAERWEASDPRLSGSATQRMMSHLYPSIDYQLEAFEYTLVNDEGSWVGTGTGIGPRGRDAAYGDAFTLAIHGAGAYEGLTAFLTSVCPSDCSDRYHWTMRGLIVGDGIPPMPE